jgi:hypothetical protein
LQIIGRVRRTCQNGAYIPRAAFDMRKHFFTNKGGVSVSGDGAEGGAASSKVAEGSSKLADEAAGSESYLLALKARTKDSLGLLRDTEGVEGAPANPMLSNPDGMMGPMKKQMAMQMPYMIMMSFVSYFFSGFVIAKIPFYLPTSFRLMVQRGVNIGALDVTYVSSLSWYFLVMFGLQGVYYLLLGANSGAGKMQMMQMQMGMSGGANPTFNAKNEFKSACDQLELVAPIYTVPAAEYKLLKRRVPDRFLPPHMRGK